MHAIIVTGFPGSGKTSISKYLSQITANEYYHFDFDVDSSKIIDHEYIIFDAVHINTERLAMTIKFLIMNYYKVDIIYMNTDNNSCKENIKKRNRFTIDIENLNINYDFESLFKKFNFGLIEIIDLKEAHNQNYFGPLTIMCENYLKIYEI